MFAGDVGKNFFEVLFFYISRDLHDALPRGFKKGCCWITADTIKSCNVVSFVYIYAEKYRLILKRGIYVPICKNFLVHSKAVRTISAEEVKNKRFVFFFCSLRCSFPVISKNC
ncbi:MAG: hypothetical protein A4E63_00319 [Syntrophorhabdus sp. PtaU1.Bin050]|nr:MAG: hypothetical protein A4E63_00319 [Syntrophorhabdus sp. PtaU1.Bin050]